MKTLFIATALAFCILGCAHAAEKQPAAAITDLNGDGHKEKIWVTIAKDKQNRPDHFVLHIDKAEATINDEQLDKFVIVDIGQADRYKEVDVQTYGGSDATYHNIYWHDGKSIRRVGKLSWDVDYKRNGIVLNKAWNCFVGVTEKYILDRKSRALERVPQEMYYIGDQHKVIEGFPIYYSRQSKSVVANVERNSKITVLIYVPEPESKTAEKHDVMQEWFLIKTQSGLLGWVRLQMLAQYVEGMQGAG